MSDIIRDSYLGVLQYSEEDELYKGKISNDNDKSIEFCFLDLDLEENLQEILEYARQIVKDIILHPKSYKIFAAEQLLELYNNSWSEGETLNIDEFASRVTLETIHIYTDDIDSTAAIYYQDGDLFWGHSIVIYINSKRELEYAEIMG